MYRWDHISDRDAEEIVCDLLSAEWRVHVERFQCGADGGIDLRARNIPSTQENDPTLPSEAIVQVKHYPSANLSRLKTTFRKEAARGIHENVRYYIATTAHLTVHAKNEISQLYGGKVPPERIYGRKDIESMLSRHIQIERRHFKLWIGNTLNLQAVLHGRSVNRGKQLFRELARDGRYLVETRDVIRARQILDSEGSVIIAGPPGVGKTCAAKILLAELISGGWEPIVAINSIDEAEDLITEGVRQVIFYDDFLGSSLRTSFLHGKNEDARITNLLETARHSDELKIILTTREYILASARMDHHRLQDRSIDLSRLIMDALDLSADERAEILYRQLYFSGVQSVLRQPLAASPWVTVLQHHGFNPRLSSFYIDKVSREVTGTSLKISNKSIAEGLAMSFDHPLELWKGIYDQQLSELQRRILQVMGTLNMVVFDDLITLTLRYMRELGEGTSRASIRAAVQAIEGDFIEIIDFDGPVAQFANASVGDYVAFRMASDPDALRCLLKSAMSFTQVQFLWRLLPWPIEAGQDEQAFRGPISLRDMDRPPSIRRTFPDYERVEVFRTCVSELTRLFRSGIYDLHPAYGSRPRRWEVMPALAADRRLRMLWSAVRSCGLEEDEQIPRGIMELLDDSRYSNRDEILSNLSETCEMENFDGWRELRERWCTAARSIFLEMLYTPEDLAYAQRYCESYGAISDKERERLRSVILTIWGEMSSTRSDYEGSGDIEQDMTDLRAAAEWLGVGGAFELPVNDERSGQVFGKNGSTEEIDGWSEEEEHDSWLADDTPVDAPIADYTTAPYRISPEWITYGDALTAARILGTERSTLGL